MGVLSVIRCSVRLWHRLSPKLFHGFVSNYSCCFPWAICPDAFCHFGFFFLIYGSENFKTLLLLQITAESFQTFPEFWSSQNYIWNFWNLENWNFNELWPTVVEGYLGTRIIELTWTLFYNKGDFVLEITKHLGVLETSYKIKHFPVKCRYSYNSPNEYLGSECRHKTRLHVAKMFF